MPHKSGYGRQSTLEYWTKQLAALLKAQVISQTIYRNAMGGGVTQRRSAVKRANVSTKPKSAAVKANAKKIKSIQKQLRVDMSTHTVKNIEAFTVSAVQNENTMLRHAAHDSNTIEAALAGLRYFNPSNPGSLTTASGATGTYSRQFLFKKNFTSIHLKSNYMVPVNCKVYACVPKNDTSISPITAYTNGLLDQNGPDPNHPDMYLSDSDQFNELWRIEKTTSRLLLAGQSMTVSHKIPDFEYDPSDLDSHALTNQRSFKAITWVVRVVGEPGHDSATLTQQGLARGGVDFVVRTKLVINYDSGTNLNDYTVVNDLDTMTANERQAQVVVDNQSYLVS